MSEDYALPINSQQESRSWFKWLFGLIVVIAMFFPFAWIPVLLGGITLAIFGTGTTVAEPVETKAAEETTETGNGCLWWLGTLIIMLVFIVLGLSVFAAGMTGAM